jgi:subfamily B ATP-binding cassette protein MsbA
VVLLEEGHIIDTGRHAELLARNRAYAKFSQTLPKPEKVVALNYRRTSPEADQC